MSVTVKAAAKRAPAKKAAAKAPAKRAPSKTPAKKRVAKKQPVKRLTRYQEMRDFTRTPEPSGAEPTSAGNSFVVQKHHATNLHYDFRLEHDGVLLSWSVPKGPSLRAGERRLAVRTEDHPLSYANFEGIIPKGEYGGGTVIVWDRGSWQPDGDAADALARGKLTFTLAGEKLSGRFHLVRTRPTAKQEQWLLFKGNDASATKSDIVSERPESAISGRQLEEVAATPGRVWHSNKKASPAPKAAAPKAANASVTATDTVSLVARLPVKVKFTNLDKVMYPESQLQKADVIAYYAAVSSRVLPQIAGRPLTLVRCPDGRGGMQFFQKHANKTTPAAIERVLIEEEGKDEPYMAVSDLDGLLSLPQLGALELHTWVAHADKVELPDQFVFDLDPDEGLGWDAVVEAALHMRDALAALELTSFVKTTGGKGLHVVAPIARKHDWDTHRAFAKGLADSLARAHPTRYLTNMRKDLRKGKLFLDYLRNGRGATAVAPYSTRAREGATVAAPISWQELEAGVDPKAFNIRTMMKRLDASSIDPWAAYNSVNQKLGPKQLRAVGVSSGPSGRASSKK